MGEEVIKCPPEPSPDALEPYIVPYIRVISTEILNSFRKPGQRATPTGDSDFYRLVASLLTGFEWLLRWFKAEMMPASHNYFFKSATFGLFGV